MKVTFRGVRFALLMYDADDRLVNGTASVGDVAGARLLAKSTLFLLPGVAYIHIHAYGDDGVMAPEPLERVDWDQEE